MWQSILGGLGWLDRFVDDEPRERLRAFVRELLRPALARLGWDASSTRPTSPVRSAGSSCNPSRSWEPTRRRSLSAASWSSREGDPQLLQAAVEAVAAEGTEDDLDRYWERYRAASTPQEEERYLFATSRFPGDAEIDGSSPRA